jgi:hypothetical protein
MTHILVVIERGVVIEAMIGSEAGLKQEVERRHPWLTRCHLCGPGYRYGDDGCRHTPTREWRDYGYKKGIVLPNGLRVYELFTVRKWYATQAEEAADAEERAEV